MAPKRRRRVSVRSDGLLELPVLVVNGGARAASELSGSITIDTAGKGALQLKNVVTEALTCHVYAGDSDEVDARLREFAAKPEIVAAYRRIDYGEWQDGVWLSGRLDAHTSDLTYILAEPSGDLTEFFLIFTISCNDGWCRASTFVQGCCVVGSGGRQARVDAEADRVRNL